MLAVPLRLSSQATHLWRPDERVVLGDFTVVMAVAATQQHLFVAGQKGLAVYDLRFRAWDLPVSVADGYPTDRVLVALADPADESVWLGTATGLVHYRPELHQFEQQISPGGITGLMLDSSDPYRGIYFRDVTGWRFLSRGGFVPVPATDLPPPGRRLAPLTVEQALAKAPAADAFQPLTLTDQRLRRYRYTCAVEVPSTGEIYFGTDGLGVIRMDPLTTRFERMPFGLIADGVGAITTVPGAVWVGTDQTALRPGFTRVSEDLHDFTFEEGARVTGFNFHGVRALLWRGRELWAATDAALWHMEPGGRVERVATGEGLPDENQFALAQGAEGVWVGTVLGLGFVPDNGRAHRVTGITSPVLALSAANDSVWVGAANGLWFTWYGSPEAYAPANVTDDGASTAPPIELRDAIVSVTRVADTVVAASVDRIMWRAPGKPWVVERIIANSIGSVFTIEGDSGAVWIGGNSGMAYYRFNSRDYRFFTAPGDLPGAVHDIAVSGDYVWVATEFGLVRFLKRALIP